MYTYTKENKNHQIKELWTQRLRPFWGYRIYVPQVTFSSLRTRSGAWDAQFLRLTDAKRRKSWFSGKNLQHVISQTRLLLDLTVRVAHNFIIAWWDIFCRAVQFCRVIISLLISPTFENLVKLLFLKMMLKIARFITKKSLNAGDIVFLDFNV